MKKLTVAMILVTFFLLSLTGCNKNADTQIINQNENTPSEKSSKDNNLTKRQILDYTLTADNALTKVFSVDKIDLQNTIKKEGSNGFEYGKSLNYKSKEKARKYLLDFFDENGIEEYMDSMTIEKNGELYILIGQEGMRPELKETNMNVTRKDNEIQIKFTSGSGENVITEDKTLIYKDNKWIFKKLWYTN